MDIKESIKKIFNLTKHGEIKASIFCDFVLNKVLEEFTHKKNADHFTQTDFNFFIKLCVDLSSSEGIDVFWSKYYNGIGDLGIEKNSSLVNEKQGPKHKYKTPINVKQYSEMPPLPMIHQHIVREYKLTEFGICHIIQYSENALIFAKKRYSEVYGEEKYFYLTYFLWYAKEFSEKYDIKIVVTRCLQLIAILNLGHEERMSELSDPIENLLPQSNGATRFHDDINKKLKPEIKVEEFLIGSCKTKWVPTIFELYEKEKQTASLKEDHKNKKEQRELDSQKLRSLFEEDDMDYGSAPENDNLPF